MSRALVVTVGTGTSPRVDIARPVAQSISNSHPEVVVFAVTAESDPIARRAAAQCRLREGQARYLPMEDMDDINIVFRQIVGAVRQLAAQGIDPADVEVDYTSGTKSMSAGAVVAALVAGCRMLKVVVGRRDPERGLVMDGTEKVQSMAPGVLLAYQDLERGHDFLRALRFDAALDLCSRITAALLDPEEGRELEELKKIARGYDRWDKFDHIGAVQELREVAFAVPGNAPYRMPREMLERLRLLGSNRKAGSITEDLVADLANNAWRRWREGKYDDAVARLYRLTEMLAQRELRRRHDVKANDVPLDRMPGELQRWLEGYRDQRSNRIQLGLSACYRLLWELESRTSPEPVENCPSGTATPSPGLGAAFMGNGRLPGLLEARNHSILAHGLQPVDQMVCQGFFGQVMSLGRLAVPDLDTRRRELQFPWLRDEADPEG